MPDLASVQMAWIRTEIARQLRRAGINGSTIDADHLAGVIPPDVGGGGVSSHDDLTGVSADDHHAQAHTLTGADHTLSGLTAGDVLTATTPTSAAFQPIGGAVPVMLGQHVLGSDAAQLTVTAIPAGYDQLHIVWAARSATAGAKGMNIRFNNDTAANYDYQRSEAANTAHTAGASVGGLTGRVGVAVGSGAPADTFGAGTVDVPYYAVTSMHKGYVAAATRKDANAVTGIFLERDTGYWRSTAAITRVDLWPDAANLVAGSRMTIYGLASAAGAGGLNHDALAGVSADDHHAQAHSGTGADHTYSGLTAGHVLTATSATAAAFAAVTAPAMVRIAETVLGATTASVTFSSIPGTYRHLRLVCAARSNAAGTVVSLNARFNGDTGATYDSQFGIALGSSLAASEAFAQTSMGIGAATAASATTSEFATTDALIPFYSFGGNNKQVLGLHGRKEALTTGKLVVAFQVSGWRSVAAITEITLFPSSGSFIAGSIFSLYAMT